MGSDLSHTASPKQFPFAPLHWRALKTCGELRYHILIERSQWTNAKGKNYRHSRPASQVLRSEAAAARRRKWGAEKLQTETIQIFSL